MIFSCVNTVHPSPVLQIASCEINSKLQFCGGAERLKRLPSGDHRSVITCARNRNGKGVEAFTWVLLCCTGSHWCCTAHYSRVDSTWLSHSTLTTSACLLSITTVSLQYSSVRLYISVHRSFQLWRSHCCSSAQALCSESVQFRFRCVWESAAAQNLSLCSQTLLCGVV